MEKIYVSPLIVREIGEKFAGFVFDDGELKQIVEGKKYRKLHSFRSSDKAASGYHLSKEWHSCECFHLFMQDDESVVIFWETDDNVERIGRFPSFNTWVENVELCDAAALTKVEIRHTCIVVCRDNKWFLLVGEKLQSLGQKLSSRVFYDADKCILTLSGLSSYDKAEHVRILDAASNEVCFECNGGYYHKKYNGRWKDVWKFKI